MKLANKVIAELGITEPDEIDLEAIAWYLGAKVKYCTLDGCEACIVGAGDRAIIRVSDKATAERQRFSIGHELGHWCHHRNRGLFCKADDIGKIVGDGQSVPKKPEEQAADAYSSDLLMPTTIFKNVARQYRNLDLNLVKEMRTVFKTSLTATALRLIHIDHTPAILVAHGPNGRKWFKRSKSVPEKWFPKKDLERDSPAFDVQFGQLQETSTLRKVGADAWFDRRDADRYEIQEQTIKVYGGTTLTILVIKDDKMLRDEEDRGNWPSRRY